MKQENGKMRRQPLRLKKMARGGGKTVNPIVPDSGPIGITGSRYPNFNIKITVKR